MALDSIWGNDLDFQEVPGKVKVQKISIMPRGATPEISARGVIFSSPAIDLTDSGWLEISLYEDILDTAVSGTIEIQDVNNIPQLIGIRGGETIHIVFNTPGFEEIYYTGTITKVSGRVFSPPFSQLFSIEFTSSEVISSMVQELRKSYRGTYAEIVNKIYNEYIMPRGKKCKIENTVGIENVNITGWTPFASIRYIATKSLSSNPRFRTPSFLFFERAGTRPTQKNTTSGFKFCSLESLWKAPPVKVYTNQPKSLIDSPTTFGRNQSNFTSINWVVEEGTPDLIKNIKRGIFGRTLLQNDLVTRLTSEQGVDTYEEFNKMNDEDLMRDLTQEFPEYTPLQVKASSVQTHSEGSEVYVGPHPEVVKVVRNNVMHRLLFNQNVRIGVPGDSERTIGEVVELAFRSPESGMDWNNYVLASPPLDKILSGKYLITAVAHKINSVSGEYETVLELSKDSNIKV